MANAREVALLGLHAGLAQRLHPYVNVETGRRSASYLVSWTGEPTVEEMRQVVAEVIDDLSLPLDPADAAYQQEKLDLQALAAEAMRLRTRGLSKQAKAELRADLLERLRRHRQHGGVAEVMAFMQTIRDHGQQRGSS